MSINRNSRESRYASGTENTLVTPQGFLTDSGPVQQFPKRIKAKRKWYESADTANYRAQKEYTENLKLGEIRKLNKEKWMGRGHVLKKSAGRGALSAVGGAALGSAVAHVATRKIQTELKSLEAKPNKTEYDHMRIYELKKSLKRKRITGAALGAVGGLAVGYGSGLATKSGRKDLARQKLNKNSKFNQKVAAMKSSENEKTIGRLQGAKNFDVLY